MSTCADSEHRVVVFSKDRPLQLHAYIASLLANSDVREEEVHVIHVHDESYQSVWNTWPDVVPVVEEGGFHNTLSRFIETLDDAAVLLWGCDDVVFFRPFSLVAIASVLDARRDITGVTLRLGTMTSGAEQVMMGGPEQFPCDVSGYSWLTDGYTGHWGYPFDLMGTAYRVGLVKRIIGAGWEFSGPNEFESIGARLLQVRRTGLWRRLNRKLRGKPTVPGSDQHLEVCRLMMLNQPSCCAAQDVNRVQDIADNRVQGGEGHAADELKAMYLDGWRLDWQVLDGITPEVCFLGDRYWRLKETQ